MKRFIQISAALGALSVILTTLFADEYEVKFFDSTAPVVEQDGNGWKVTGLSDPEPTVTNITPPPPPPPSIGDIVYRTPVERNAAEHLWESATDLEVVYDRAILDSDNADILRHCVGTIGFDSNGHIYVAQNVRDEHAAPSDYEGAGLVVSKSMDDGATWEQVLRLPSGGETKKPLLVPYLDSFRLVVKIKENPGSYTNPAFPPGSYCVDLSGNIVAVHDTFGSNNKPRFFYADPVPLAGGSYLLYDREQMRWFETSDGGATLAPWPATQQLRGAIKNETAYLFQGSRLWDFARNESIHYVDPPYEGANSWVEALAKGDTHGHGGLSCAEFGGKYYVACRNHYDEGGSPNTYWTLHEANLTTPGYTDVLRIDDVGGSDGGYSSMEVHDDGSGPALYVLYDAATPAGWTSKEHVPWLIKLRVSQ